ncbi:KOW domain-containing RNA-binding protein [Clostridium chrysemydis]|uniref:KOW domain-containing RNA-binding protein n=1 Tax=Clostridium chrysemydis TaxID=2665504 RepID=UPI001883381A|nr:KOW domain-containing RNA-binding protein [Clostridium chrysemydis]
MQNNDLIGKVVLSLAGRDKDHLYVVVGTLDKDYVLLSDGNTKTISKPKKKRIKHLNLLESINEDLINSIRVNKKDADLKIKRFLKLRGIVKEG